MAQPEMRQETQRVVDQKLKLLEEAMRRRSDGAHQNASGQGPNSTPSIRR
jgi:hypothetical protein